MNFNFGGNLEVWRQTPPSGCAKLELQASSVRSTVGEQLLTTPVASSGVSKNVSLIPVFHISEVESYFGVFEHIAGALHWPMDVWTVLLQFELSGKVLEACASLSLEDSLRQSKECCSPCL